MPGWARETNEVSCLPTTVVSGAHTHAHTDIHRHTETHTHTQTHRHTHAHTDTHTHRKGQGSRAREDISAISPVTRYQRLFSYQCPAHQRVHTHKYTRQRTRS